jgi:hypothetical protein
MQPIVFVGGVMASDVPATDAFKEVPLLLPAGEWFDRPGADNLSEPADASATDAPIDEEIVLEPRHMQALQEDIDQQVTAAEDFTALLAAKIIDSADASLDAAARLGSHRVVALLTWTCATPTESGLRETPE